MNSSPAQFPFSNPLRGLFVTLDFAARTFAPRLLLAVTYYHVSRTDLATGLELKNLYVKWLGGRIAACDGDPARGVVRSGLMRAIKGYSVHVSCRSKSHSNELLQLSVIRATDNDIPCRP